MDVSIIICTRNRCADLKATLQTIVDCIARQNQFSCEVLVVDNNSHDETATVVHSAASTTPAVRYVHEPRPGQSNARNRGLAEARGNIILFTDDDVRPPARWLAGMCGPVRDGKARAVAGGIYLAPHLTRDWMTTTHRSWLASSEYLNKEKPQQMIGANMAFARSVLASVPAFDEELGPGALGGGDDSLFAWQLREAGISIYPALDVAVEHVFEPSRLSYQAWQKAATVYGQTRAYLAHHWWHEDIRWPFLRYVWNWSRLRTYLRKSTTANEDGEGCSDRELVLRSYTALYRGLMRESKRSRNYDRRGLVKHRLLPK